MDHSTKLQLRWSNGALATVSWTKKWTENWLNIWFVGFLTLDQLYSRCLKWLELIWSLWGCCLMVSNYVMIFYSAQLLQQFVQKDKYPCHAKQWPTPTSWIDCVWSYGNCNSTQHRSTHKIFHSAHKFTDIFIYTLWMTENIAMFLFWAITITESPYAITCFSCKISFYILTSLFTYWHYRFSHSYTL